MLSSARYAELCEKNAAGINGTVSETIQELLDTIRDLDLQLVVAKVGINTLTQAGAQIIANAFEETAKLFCEPRNGRIPSRYVAKADQVSKQAGSVVHWFSQSGCSLAVNGPDSLTPEQLETLTGPEYRVLSWTDPVVPEPVDAEVES